MPKRYWARLRADLDCPLRRGAWYGVRRLRPPEAVVDVMGEQVPVPRSALEISSARPLRWSVVSRPKNPARFPGVTEYAVCPNCSARVPLTERLARMECRRCEMIADVAWDDPCFKDA
ncbi:MAG TPA: hypothetical protein VJN39_08390 [Gemmatimonadales bacterium]|nr:hypothetical protein [Gemmatimonadales bacterium]